MRYLMTVSPDFTPDKIAGWYIFNTWLQRQLLEQIHLELYPDFSSQRVAIQRDEVDLIYANPFDAAVLVREKGFKAIAAPAKQSDEVIIAVPVDFPCAKIEDVNQSMRIAATDDPDVNLIAMIMLEPANLTASELHSATVDTYVLVAKQLIQGKADMGFFLKDAYYSLSTVIQRQLKVIACSDIQVIRHVFLAGPRLQHCTNDLRKILPSMQDMPKGKGVLDSLGFNGWEIQEQEDTEFMIDLMDTLMG